MVRGGRSTASQQTQNVLVNMAGHTPNAMEDAEVQYKYKMKAAMDNGCTV